MRFILKFGIYILRILYFPFKLLPIQNKIVYISRQSEESPLDFRLICDELEKNNLEIKNVFLIKPIKNGLINKLEYLCHMFRQMYHIATAKIVLLDGYCILISVLKHKESLVIIQMWHAIGALKKFGYSILDKEEGRNKEIADVLKMHKNYTYVFTSGEECRKYYAEAFNQSIEKIKVFPLPRIDLLLNTRYHDLIKENILKKYPQLNAKEKRVIVYAPTFRKNENDLNSKINELLNKIDYRKCNVILKPHPLSKVNINNSNVIFDKKFTTEDFFLVADVIITDYSAILFEALLLKKSLILYAYDYESYCQKRDFYIDYKKTFQSILCDNSDKVVERLSDPDYHSQNYNRFISSMVRETRRGYTKEIVSFLESLL